MKPTLLDTGLCLELISNRPCRHHERVLQCEGELHLSSITAFELYSAISGLPAEQQHSASAVVDEFIARFNWVDTSYPGIKKAGLHFDERLGDLPHFMQLNILLAKSHGLSFALSKDSSFVPELTMPGVDLLYW